MSRSLSFVRIEPRARTLEEVELAVGHADDTGPTDRVIASLVGTAEWVSPEALVAAARALGKTPINVDVHQVAVLPDASRVVVFCRGDVRAPEIASLFGFTFGNAPHPFFDTCFVGVFPPRPRAPTRGTGQMSAREAARVFAAVAREYPPASTPRATLAAGGVSIRWARGDEYDATRWVNYADRDDEVAFRRVTEDTVVPVARRQRFLCAVCGQEARKKCSVCRAADYCGKDCQTRDWRAHKRVCAALSSGAPRPL